MFGIAFRFGQRGPDALSLLTVAAVFAAILTWRAVKKMKNEAGVAGARAVARLCVVGIALAVVLTLLPGCSYLRRPQGQPKARVASLQADTNGVPGSMTVRSLQIEVMRFADNYVSLVARAADDFNANANTPEARLVATKWKLEQATAAYINGSGPNPVINALDMVVLASVSRMVMEDNLSVDPFRQAALPLLETHRKMETSALTLVSGVMKPDQLQDLKALIIEWRKNNPQQRNVTGLRFREFMNAFSKMPQRTSSTPTSLFSLLFLDPMASMDPTTAAIEETRNTAERAMYYTQRMPALLNWQIELLTYEMAVQPETKQLLADTATFAKSSEAFAKTAEQLPKVISEQREAAIKQFVQELAPEEKNVREILAEARKMTVEAKDTLAAGTATANSVNAAIKTLDEFVRSVTTTNSSAGVTNRRPFDVLDYAKAARDVGGAARDVNLLLTSATTGASSLAQLRQQTAADAKGVVDYALGRAVALLLALVAACLVAGLIYRLATRSSRPDRRAGDSPCQK